MPLPMGPPGADWRYSQLSGEPPVSFGQESSSPSSPQTIGPEVPLVPEGPGGAHRRRRRNRPGDEEDGEGGGGWFGEDMPLHAQTKKVGWVVPWVTLFLALFVQNGGTYFGTCSYIRWMDELASPAPLEAADGAPATPEPLPAPTQMRPADALQAAIILPDPISDMMRSTRLSGLLSAPAYGIEFWIDFLSSLFAALWLGCVARTHDLRLWTKVLTTGAVLAVLKGFLAWAVVLPDPTGWDGCRNRLGPDGLMYFRQVSFGDIGPVQAVEDILLLELKGLWMMGRAGRQHICADTIIASPTCYCTLLVVSLYDAVRDLARDCEHSRRTAVLSAAGAGLVLGLLLDVACTLANPRHYSVDVFLAVPLTVLVYSSPPVALVAERWLAFSLVGGPAAAPPPAPAAASSSGSRGEARPAAASELSLKDVAEITALPCCVPLSHTGSPYYVRASPGTPQQRPWTEETRANHIRQVAQFTQIRERDSGRRRILEGALEEERRRAQERAGEADAQADRRLHAKEQELAQLEEKLVVEARAKLQRDRQAAAELAEQASGAAARLEQAEAAFRERRGRQEGLLAAARSAAETARAAGARHEESARRLLHEAEALRSLLKRLEAELSNPVKEQVSASAA